MIDDAQMQRWIGSLLAMDIECAQIARTIGPEAYQRGFESNGTDALYQAWCLIGGARLDIAAEWLRRAAAQLPQGD